MKRFSFGLITGLLAGLLLATATFALAGQNIKLIVNGREIQCDVPPQLINGRVLVPARPLAEALGAKVEWNGEMQAVVVTKEGVSVATRAAEEFNIANNYYTVRQILAGIRSKYPDMKHVTRDNIEIKQGEFRFDTMVGELWFNGQKFALQKKTPDSAIYFSITPLIEANVLIPSDIHLPPAT